MQSNPYFNKGKRVDFAFVFSCPGQEEERNLKPVCGRTGENLEILLRYLSQEIDFMNSYTGRYDFRITNASSRVHYKEKTGRSEELDSFLFSDENLIRLREDIKGIEKYILCFGKKAEKTIRKLRDKYPSYLIPFRLICTRHLGNQSLNRMKLKQHDSSKTEYKLKLLAKKIADEIQSPVLPLQ